MTSRDAIIQNLRTTSFDVLIIGGGINGAGVARDLALRSKTSGQALRAAVVDKYHFGSGTSGRNSHLIHGGLRYLKYFDFGLVREALHERAVLLEIAPHLVEPLAFVMPFESWSSAMFYRTGLMLYDVLAGGASIERHRSISKRQLERIYPDLRHQQFTSGAIFYDARVASARLVLENVIEAASNGVVAANYVEVLERRPGWNLRMRDTLSGDEFDVQARTVVDATGAWTDTDGVRLVRGSHLIFPARRPHEYAIAYFEDSGRIVFFIPWGESRDQLLVGTTDVDHDAGPDDVHISRAEIEYLKAITRKVLREGSVDEPVAAFSSLRPLVKEKGRSATSTSRDHKIFRDEDGIVRITGGKYTTYRAMSEEAVDLALPELEGKCTTAQTPLNGNTRAAIERLMSSPDPDIRRLVRTYGVRAPDVLALYKTEGEAAPIAFAATCEMAQRLRDVMFVSTTWGYEDRWTPERLLDYSSVLGRHLGWDAARIRAEAEDVMSAILRQELLDAAPLRRSPGAA